MITPLILTACSTSNLPVEPAVPGPLPEVEVVSLTTSDNVTLQGDFYATQKGAPAFVLLHMIPPFNDRSNWPVAFVDALRVEGWAALLIDRRGAGGSEGEAQEAFEGPNGRLDVEAAVRFVVDQGYGPIVLIGASNGTTSMVDYAAWAEGADRTVPVGLGFMTGGAYTENQTAMSDLPSIPSIFTYSTAEDEWSEAQQSLDPGSWSFLEYDGGDHGTRMFDAKPRVTRNLVDFFRPLLVSE